MSSEPTTYVVKLKNRFPVAERTMAFQFEKPENFVFRPGQWIDISCSILPKRTPKAMCAGSQSPVRRTKTCSWWRLECAIPPSSVNWEEYP
jgi:hypothetical protein